MRAPRAARAGRLPFARPALLATLVALALGGLPPGTSASSDALLAVESNRANIVESVVERFGAQVERMGFSAEALRAQLMSLRADQLLAASLVRDLAALDLARPAGSEPLQQFVATTPTALHAAAEIPEALAYVARIDGTLQVLSAAQLAALRGQPRVGDTLVGWFVDGAAFKRVQVVLGEAARGGSDGSTTTSEAKGSTPAAGNWLGYTGGGNTVGGTASGVMAGTGNAAVAGGAAVIAGTRNRAEGVNALVGAGAGNLAQGTLSVIGGGGRDGGSEAAGANASDNVAFSKWTVIGGGMGNRAGLSGQPLANGVATVAGGHRNVASGKSSFIGGGGCNVASGVSAVIAGGGATEESLPCESTGNLASGFYSTVGGGQGNKAESGGATVAGGRSNRASSSDTTVSGGLSNTASSFGSTVGGGEYNTAGASYSVVGGGGQNETVGSYGTVGGGFANFVNGLSGTVSGGAGNNAFNNYATVGGGKDNQAGNVAATVGGGVQNIASSLASTIGGGDANTATASRATVAGGFGNRAGGINSFVGGGNANYADGNHSAIPGGLSNRAVGDYSVVMGRRAISEQAALIGPAVPHAGAFVFADSTDADFRSAGANTFNVRSSGGVRIYTASNLGAGVFLNPGSGTWASVSDRDAKTDVAPVRVRELLDRVLALPLATWRYRTESGEVRHLGPMAQDFRALFGLGHDDRTITTVDADGVALAAIQGLNAKLEAEHARLREENRALRARLETLERRLAAPVAPTTRAR